ncbi:xanthine dehydrogenase [Shewanella sp. 10N.286.52.C2]|uniref:xanthine dehydrogenase family protein molybdopterin-binding subunit n=1 Tax=unclassified Shewanella TaxID=196818 RepID=UPI000C81C024|nr:MULTISPECIES: molybdopterin cofactor-binding domain-containing protein [unclassified Shewanella]MDO6774070.1 molybdopterin-dependent oxidoreductase [Shewanella sp. 3_MG-2023]PMG27572.1 xanthine dehydrogenase [Shewanella sp. 10N.286.52.C2]PMH95144.1 xanthine dehydrogenase [Shewanella sp. 10N.286.48.A6]
MNTGNTDLSRRGFIKKCVIGGVAVYSAPMIFDKNKAFAATTSEQLKAKWNVGAKPAYRYDAIEKVTGQKIYGRDYRAQDIPDWPKKQHYAHIIRVNRADKILVDLDLSSIPDNAKPYFTITAKTLKDNQLKLPDFYGKNMLLPLGNTPDYQGHEVAILLFDTFIKYKQAKAAIEFNDAIFKWGESTPLVTANQDPYACWRIIRQQGDGGSDAEDKYSTLHDGLIFPDYENHKPVWSASINPSGNSAEKAMYYASELQNDLTNPDWLVIDKNFTTQSIEPMMLEPEAFNGWFDKNNARLHVVICSQSPQDFYAQAGEVLAKSPLSVSIKELIVHTPYIGGGFGAKDHTIFPYYGIIASLYSTNPVRIANDRFQQFQSGLKRHTFNMDHKLAFDKKTKKITGLVTNMVLAGGGRKNFSDSVTMVGASAIQSIYYLPRNDIQAWCHPSATPHAGSMRGYGTLQSMGAMEMMINEAAEALDIDTFELRRINAFKTGQKNTQGATPNGKARYVEMLDLAEKHDIWVNRQQNKADFEKANPTKMYGVGFGIATKDYGTGAEAPSASVAITPEGKIVIQVCSIEMGTGTETSQGALIAKYLGNMADEVHMAKIQEFDAMELIENDNPYTMSQAHQDEMSKKPTWTPAIGMASSASQSSFFQSHATAQAAKFILQYSLIPAAAAIINGQSTAKIDPATVKYSWDKGAMVLAGQQPIPFALLAKKAHAMGLITSVMTHAFNRWEWATADFDINGKKQNFPLDAIAIQYGIGATAEQKQQYNAAGYQVIKRLSVNYPKTNMNNAMVTYYTPCATLVEIAIDKQQGNVEILRTHSWIEPGNVHVKELVEGQLEGGLTMGVGHALYEYLPDDETGAGTGKWNLDRYQVPFAKHNGVWNMKHTIMPPLSDSDDSKGVAEVVMIPVVPALVEAIYQATNQRFYHLPITPQDILKAI